MTKDQLRECLPILSSIFVKWKWIVVWVLTMCISFAGLSFQSGRVIQSQNERILKNTDGFKKIELKIESIEMKLDSILLLLKG